MAKSEKILNAAPFEQASSAHVEAIAAALSDLAAAHRRLNELKAIRSQRFIGDLGEWVASQLLQMALCSSQTEKGCDLVGGGLKVQVKTTAKKGKKYRTTLRADALAYHALAIVILSPDLLLERVFVLPLSRVESSPIRGRQRRAIQWSGNSEFAMKAIPSALSQLRHAKSALVVDDDRHAAELTRLRALMSPGGPSAPVASKGLSL